MQTPIYLDHHATTPCDPRVLEAMLPAFREDFGNASSRQHAFGRRAAEIVEAARSQVAGLIGCEPREVIFTSGATESNNLAIKGAALAGAARGRHIVTCAIEHKSVLDSCQRLEALGFEVTYLPVGGDGRVTPGQVEAALTSGTVLVSLMLGNNEIGTIHPLAEIGALLAKKGILFHCDAAQALATLDSSVEELGAGLLSLSAHKLYGPKGAGALYVRRRRPHARLEPLIDGGGHERGLRSGTLNVPGIVGLGKACEIAAAERDGDARRIRVLRDLLLDRLRAALPDLIVNGSMEHRLPGNLNVTFPGVQAERLLEEMPGVAASSGSACSSPAFDSSYVLKCLERPEPKELGGVRFGLGRATTLDAIERAAAEAIAAARRLREASPREPASPCARPCD